ncbi:MAG: hypothetical protein A4E28_01533 [Methanocella sp. PtaU1.Bin125]|nr:MAG: hypothetical protein A4E28_01533 [Methanocella sp. PtaU1.Bin125]
MTANSPLAEGDRAADIIDWGTDKDVYRAGDRPTAFIEIRNNGARPIDDAVVKLTVSRKMPLGSITLIKDQAHKASEFVPGFRVPPGKSRRFEVSPFQIPDTSLARGTYELKAEIVIEERPVVTLRKAISVK